MPQSARKIFDDAKELLSATGSYRRLRTALHRVEGPALPYMGVYLTDLTFIEDGNRDETEDGLVNFKKRAAVAQVLSTVRRYQCEPYAFEQISEIQQAFRLRFTKALSDADMYALSLKFEPRESQK